MLACFYFFRSYSYTAKELTLKIKTTVKGQISKVFRNSGSSLDIQSANSIEVGDVAERPDLIAIQNLKLNVDGEMEIPRKIKKKISNVSDIPNETAEEESPRNPIIYVRSKEKRRDSFSVAMRNSGFSGLSRDNSRLNSPSVSNRSSFALNSPASTSTFGILSAINVNDKNDPTSSLTSTNRLLFPQSTILIPQEFRQHNDPESPSKKSFAGSYDDSPISKSRNLLFNQDDTILLKRKNSPANPRESDNSPDSPGLKRKKDR